MTRPLSVRVIAVALLAFLGCTDRPTEPVATRSVSPAATYERSAAPSQTASVVWQATSRGFVASRLLSPIVAARAYALLSLAQYAAVVAAQNGTGDNDASQGKSPSKMATERGAIAGASAEVLTYIFPLDAAAIENQLSAEAAEGNDGMQLHFARGAATGRATGDVVVQRARGDGFANANGTPKVWDPATLPSGPTLWAMDADATPHVPAGFQFPAMQPYTLNSARQFRPPLPPADITPALNEVVAIVAARTAAQEAIARFWNLNTGSATAAGYWANEAANYITAEQLDERAAAHVFAVLGAATMDAVIGCWDAKYHYLVRRPWMMAPAQLPNSKLIIGRPNHPSYPSGHSCVSSASGRVLKSFFPQHSSTIDAQVAEAGMSRIYAGIHYRFDIEQGQALGASVAQWAIQYDRQRGILAAVLPANP